MKTAKRTVRLVLDVVGAVTLIAGIAGVGIFNYRKSQQEGHREHEDDGFVATSWNSYAH